MSQHRRGALRALAAAGLAAAGLAVSASPAAALTTTNSCRFSVDGLYRDLDLGLEAPATTAEAGSTITLSGGTVVAALPSWLAETGVAPGLTQVGENEIPSRVWVAIAGSNTAEGVQVIELSTVARTTITMDGGTPRATPIVVRLPMPETTWTPTGAGEVVFTQAPSGGLGEVPGAGLRGETLTPAGSILISATLAGGSGAVFDCVPGTSINRGNGFQPVPAGAFATATVTEPAPEPEPEPEPEDETPDRQGTPDPEDDVGAGEEPGDDEDDTAGGGSTSTTRAATTTAPATTAAPTTAPAETTTTLEATTTSAASTTVGPTTTDGGAPPPGQALGPTDDDGGSGSAVLVALGAIVVVAAAGGAAALRARKARAAS